MRWAMLKAEFAWCRWERAENLTDWPTNNAVLKHRELASRYAEGRGGTMLRRRLVLLLSVSALMMGLTGCGVGSPASRASADGVINRAAFQGTGLKPGMELGWDNRLYQLVTTVPPTKVGLRLGEVSYHGNIGMVFSLYALAGHSTSYGIVFKTDQGRFFEGLRAKPLGGPPLKSS